jgi:hypothetical protein
MNGDSCCRRFYQALALRFVKKMAGNMQVKVSTVLFDSFEGVEREGRTRDRIRNF